MAIYVLFIYIILLALVIFLTILNMRVWSVMQPMRREASAATVMALIGAVPVAGAFLPDSSFKFLLQSWGNILLGIFIFYGTFLVAATLLGLVMKVFRHHHRVPVICLVLALGFNVYGMVNAQDVRVTHLTVDLTDSESAEAGSGSASSEAGSEDDSAFSEAGSTAGGAAAQEASADRNLRIVLVADLHMSVNSRPQLIRDMVSQVNEADADLVLIAGDFFTSTYDGLKNPEEYIEILKTIKSRYGVYAVYGNHDTVEVLMGGFPLTAAEKALRDPRMEEFLVKSGITVLEDECVTIEKAGVVIAGRRDVDKPGDGEGERLTAEELLGDLTVASTDVDLSDESTDSSTAAASDTAISAESISDDSTSNESTDIDRNASKTVDVNTADMPVIVLEHEPVEYSELAAAGADLVLSGHTHAGQIFPGNLIVRFFNENAYGEKVVDGMETIVTQGVGYYGPPLRIGTHSEVMVIDVTYSE